MRKGLKRLFCTVFLVVSLAVPVYGWSSTPLLVDGANLLSSSEEEVLLETLEQISSSQKMDIVIVTTKSLQGYSPRNYADDFYDYNGYAEDGVLLLISMEDRDWYISATGYGSTAVTDAGVEYIADCFLDDLSSGYYYDAFMTYAQLCDEFIDQAKTGRPYDVGNLPKEPFSVGFNLLISIVVGFIAALIVTTVMRSQLNSVHFQGGARNYVKKGSLQVTSAREMFLYRHVHRRAKPKQNSSGGGSRTHRSSSGRSHSGGGGKF